MYGMEKPPFWQDVEKPFRQLFQRGILIQEAHMYIYLEMKVSSLKDENFVKFCVQLEHLEV